MPRREPAQPSPPHPSVSSYAKMPLTLSPLYALVSEVVSSYYVFRLKVCIYHVFHAWQPACLAYVTLDSNFRVLKARTR